MSNKGGQHDLDALLEQKSGIEQMLASLERQMYHYIGGVTRAKRRRRHSNANVIEFVLTTVNIRLGG